MNPESLKAAGWQSHAMGGFHAAISPVWMKHDESGATLGLLAGLEHRNETGSVHGGALMTFADIALGYNASFAIDRAPCTTAQLQIQFVSTGKFGEFITCRGEVVRATRDLVFMRGLIKSGERTVASADGIWKILNKKTQ
jgi:acyl-coenzyme A thioesterase PaaI-like protein